MTFFIDISNPRNSKNIVEYVIRNARNKILTKHCFGEGGDVKLNYSVPSYSIKGTEVTQLSGFVLEKEGFEAGLKKVRERTQKGVTIVTNVFNMSVLDLVKTIKESGRPYPLIYIGQENKPRNRVTNASSEEVKMWMKNRDERDLITELAHIRGWEDTTILVFEYGFDIENICLRAVSNLIIVSFDDKNDDDDEDNEIKEKIEMERQQGYEIDYLKGKQYINQDWFEDGILKDEYAYNFKYKRANEKRNCEMEEAEKDIKINDAVNKEWFQKGFLIRSIANKVTKEGKEMDTKRKDVKDKGKQEWFQKGFLLNRKLSKEK